MGASFAVEFQKLGKRPATWVIGAIFVVLVILLGYGINYALIAVGGGPAAGAGRFVELLLPQNVAVAVLSTFGRVGAALAVIVGALAVGSEYRWDTLKSVLTRKPGRIGFLVGKLGALAAVVAILTVAVFVVGAIAGYIISLLQDASASLPAVGSLAGGLGAGWLILAAYAALGFFLAVIFRSAAISIAIGLVYVVVVEGIITSLGGRGGRVGEIISNAVPGGATTNLTGAFAPSAGLGASGPLAAPSLAAVVLGGYVVVLTGVAALVFLRRDVT